MSKIFLGNADYKKIEKNLYKYEEYKNKLLNANTEIEEKSLQLIMEDLLKNILENFMNDCQIKLPQIFTRERTQGTVEYLLNVPAKITINGKRKMLVAASEKELVELFNTSIVEYLKHICNIHMRNVTVEEYVDSYIRGTKRLKDSSKNIYERNIRKYIIGTDFGKMQMQFVTKRDCEKCLEEIKRKSSAQITKSILSMSFENALGEDIVVKNPMAAVKGDFSDKETDKRENIDRIFSEEDARVVEQGVIELWNLHKSKYEHGIIYPLLYSSGMRIGELLALKWEDIHWGDVDAENGYIDIHKTQSITTSDGVKEYVITTPKSKKSVRKIPLSYDMVKWLKILKQRNKEKKIISPYVICNKKGDMLKMHSVYKKLHKFCEVVEIEYVPTHGCRKTFATRLYYNLGLNIKDIADILGHESASTTEKYYIKSDVTKRDMSNIHIFNTTVAV